MNAAVVRRTQEALGKVIRRPPLTEKLLNKPPFRYLHDIITEVIRITGFMKGLYTDAEMKSDNVKKAIDVVMMVSGEPLAAKPARIVAGHEPERTNELLQLIGKCCLNKLSSDEAVKRVLAGEKGDSRGRAARTSKAPESDNKGMKEEESRTHKEDKRSSEGKERSTSAEHKQKEELKDENKPREKERDKDKAKEPDRDRHRDSDKDRNRDGEREKARTRAKQDRDRSNKDRDREAERDKERDRRKPGDAGNYSRAGEAMGLFGDESVRLCQAEVSAGASRSLPSKTSKRRSKNSLEGTAKLPVHVAGMEAGLCVWPGVVAGSLGEHSTATHWGGGCRR
ncbi:hypothetical protein U0070_007946 [Myodes glareolus]|uniref:TRAF3-interacting protein 1 n=1 Tax=Myodes glareolus TaxID=447135 RepID=A0AAW0IGD6_MYOGA